MGRSSIGNIHPEKGLCKPQSQSTSLWCTSTGVTSKVHQMILFWQAVCQDFAGERFPWLPLFRQTVFTAGWAVACKLCLGSDILMNNIYTLNTVGCSFLFYREGFPKWRGPAKHPSFLLTGKQMQKVDVENLQKVSSQQLCYRVGRGRWLTAWWHFCCMDISVT